MLCSVYVCMYISLILYSCICSASMYDVSICVEWSFPQICTSKVTLKKLWIVWWKRTHQGCTMWAMLSLQLLSPMPVVWGQPHSCAMTWPKLACHPALSPNRAGSSLHSPWPSHPGGKKPCETRSGEGDVGERTCQMTVVRNYWCNCNYCQFESESFMNSLGPSILHHGSVECTSCSQTQAQFSCIVFAFQSCYKFHGA